MKSRSKVVCFVDDDPDEVYAFKDAFGDDFTVIAGTTPQPVLAELEKRSLRANLFVLDLYFAEGRASSENDRNQMVQLKAEVDRSQKILTDFLAGIGQSRDGGLEIMRYIRENYPTTPVVFFTRKGTLADAVACMDAGADGILPKAMPKDFDPNGNRRDQFTKAARDHHDALATSLFCKASTSNVLKKLIRICKFIWNNWSKL